MISTNDTYIVPSTIKEALEFTAQMKGGFKYIAGGTDVMVNRFQGNERATALIDISGIKELKGVSDDGDYLRIGSMETLHDLQRYPEIKSNFPMLAEAAAVVGSPLIRKTATIGGNVLCENRCLFYNQSEWWRDAIGHCLKCEGDFCIATGGKNACFSELVSDTAPALIAMDAMIEMYDLYGKVNKKLEDIYTGDGVNPRNISKTAIIAAIHLPLNRNYKTVFLKLRERNSLEFTSLTSAVAMDDNNKVKICLSGVDPKPVVVTGSRFDNTEELIIKVLKGSRAVDNDMYSRNYRREMIRVFLKKSFHQIGMTAAN